MPTAASPGPLTRSRRAVFAPLGEVSRAAQVEQRLAGAIRAGLLVADERLPAEPELAAMLGVATVTVREALTGLRGQGLVRTTRGRGGGTFVAARGASDEEALVDRLVAMSRVELHDRSTHYRLVLTGCAELAAERAEQEDAEALRDLLLPASETDPGAWRQADAEISLSVAALTQSARVLRDVVALEADFGPVARTTLGSPEARERTAAHHARLVEAIAAGDAAAARGFTKEHWGTTLTEVARLQATRGPSSRPRSAS